MPRVTIIQQVFNSRKWMELVYPAMVNQSFQDAQIVAQIVVDDGGCEEYIRSNFPQITIEKPGYNIGFAKGHNEIFAKYESEFYQLVNPDLILDPNYIEEILKVFEANPRLGAATGKLLQYKFADKQKTNVIDTTGVIASRNGRARDRGQHEVDSGQYDNLREVVAVSGAGPMYRREALEDVRMPVLSFPRRRESLLESKDVELSKDPRLRGDDKGGDSEYFDEDFGSYWEDVDLSIRMQSRDWQCEFVPAAVAYHGRVAASAKKDYADVVAYKKHHNSLAPRIKQLNYKNHIFLAIKNFPTLSWKFFVREFIMLGYVILLETSTLKILPIFFKQFPLMLKKRKWIKQNRKILEWSKMLNNKGLLS